MAATHKYIDPLSGSDVTGDGSSGNPWATLQHALDNTTYNASGGNVFNLVAGAPDVLTAALDFTTFGEPTSLDGPCIFRGEGGLGAIDGDGGSIIAMSWLPYIHLVDLDLYNSGNNVLIEIGDHARVIGCTLHNVGTAICLSVGTNAFILGNHLYGCSSGYAALSSGSLARILRNAILPNSAGGTASNGLVSSTHALISENLVAVNGASNGIYFTGSLMTCLGNLVYGCAGGGAAGSGSGIHVGGDTLLVASNIAVGFAGTGGTGITIASGASVDCVARNFLHNNSTHVANGGALLNVMTDDLILTSNPFVAADSDDFALNNTPGGGAAVRAAGWPGPSWPGGQVSYADGGPLQHRERGLLVHPGMCGGARG
jgi:hypothetical protein